MNFPPPSPKQRKLIFAIVVVVTLFAGLYPKEYDFRNHVEANAEGDALQFSQYGVAFTEPIFDSTLANSLNDDGFEISLTLGPESEKQEGFAFIAQIHSGDDETQLLIARWGDHLIVMNGADYKHKLKHPRVSATLTKDYRSDGVEVLVRSTQNGTEIFLNGERVAERRGMSLAIPSSPKPGRLVIGNSIDGTHSWAGEIQKVEIGNVRNVEPPLQYRMSDFLSSQVLGSGTIDTPLHIPVRSVVVERELLAWRFNHQFELSRSFVGDFLLNLLGFIPFGMALCGLLHLRRLSLLQRLVIVFISAALVSLLIEYVQTWFPSRSSSSFDLLLNVVGGTVGVFVWAFLFPPVKDTKKAD
jgi:hypothetical protein